MGQPDVTQDDIALETYLRRVMLSHGAYSTDDIRRRLAAHRLAERDRITAIIRDLYTHANETIDPEDLLRLIEVIEGKHNQQPTERDDDE